MDARVKGRLVLCSIRNLQGAGPPTGVGRQVDHPFGIEALLERAASEQLQVGRLADLPGAAQGMERSLAEIDLAHDLGGKSPRPAGQADQVRIPSFPARTRPPGILLDDLCLGKHLDFLNRLLI